MKNLEYCRNYQNVTHRHKVSKSCLKNSARRLTPSRLATTLQFVKNALPVKHSKANTVK